MVALGKDINEIRAASPPSENATEIDADINRYKGSILNGNCQSRNDSCLDSRENEKSLHELLPRRESFMRGVECSRAVGVSKSGKHRLEHEIVGRS